MATVKKFTFRKYQASDAVSWNEFVKNSVNGTFLFNRNFMDYHSDRFADYSIIVEDSKKCVALFPANISNNVVHSHQGLTYGGLIFKDDFKLQNLIELMYQMLQFFESEKITTLCIKSIPYIYFKKPADGLSYALFLLKAKF